MKKVVVQFFFVIIFAHRTLSPTFSEIWFDVFFYFTILYKTKGTHFQFFLFANQPNLVWAMIKNCDTTFMNVFADQRRFCILDGVFMVYTCDCRTQN